MEDVGMFGLAAPECGCMRMRTLAAVLVIAAAFVAPAAWAQETSPDDAVVQEVQVRTPTEPQGAVEKGDEALVEENEPEPVPVQEKTPPYRSKGHGAQPNPDPPAYVKTMREHGEYYGIDALKELDWLDFGLVHRTRFELRDDYYFRGPPENHDEQFLLRSQVYLGIRDVLDPLRFAIEFMDARQFMSEFPEDTRDVNEADFLQAYGELYFKDALGPGYPIRFRAGRMTFDYDDRKLIVRNNWRNAIDAYDGFRLQMGDPSSDWELDFFAAMLVEILQARPDRPDEERWFYGLLGAWRGWSQYVTFEPYYFILDQDRSDPTRDDRTIHTLGLHAFGPIGESGFDYDVDAAFQFGDDGPREQRAFAAYGELGYTIDHAWKPRVSISTLYASGDRDPDDGVSEGFDRLRSPRHPPSITDLFVWQNTISPRLRWGFQPHKRLRIDGGYGAHWLASDSDAWPLVGRRDPLGESGDFVGQDIDIRARYQLYERAELEIGYAYFIPGDFVQNTGPADDSDFLYVSLTVAF